MYDEKRDNDEETTTTVMDGMEAAKKGTRISSTRVGREGGRRGRHCGAGCVRRNAAGVEAGESP